MSRKGLSASVYPQVEFGTPGTRAVEEGLAEPGQTLILPLLVAKEFKYFTMVAVLVNVGVIHGVRKVVVYAHLGRSLLSDDGLVHTYIGIGLKLMIKPPKT